MSTYHRAADAFAMQYPVLTSVRRIRDALSGCPTLTLRISFTATQQQPPETRPGIGGDRGEGGRQAQLPSDKRRVGPGTVVSGLESYPFRCLRCGMSGLERAGARMSCFVDDTARYCGYYGSSFCCGRSSMLTRRYALRIRYCVGPNRAWCSNVFLRECAYLLCRHVCLCRACAVLIGRVWGFAALNLPKAGDESMAQMSEMTARSEGVSEAGAGQASCG